MIELLLTPLTIDHIDQVLEIDVLSFRSPWSRQSYEAEFAENSLAYYRGIWQGPRLLAFGGFWQIADEGHITNVAVHPSARRQGLAQILLRRIMTDCRALGGNSMTLEVRENNIPARRLYQKMGFEESGMRPRYYENGENAVIMWKTLK